VNEHRKANGLLPAFALGELGSRESSEVKAHLAECEQCRQESKRLDALLTCTNALRALSADEETCASARESLLEAVAREEMRQPAARYEWPAALVWRAVVENRIAKFAAAAALVLVGFGVVHFATQRDHGAAFAAQVLEQIENTKAITWKTTYYMQVTSRDGKRTWIETETRQEAYKSPGLYREVFDDTAHGQIPHVTITDAVNRRELTLVPEEKRATVRGIATLLRSPRGPFVWVGEVLRERNVEWVEERETATGRVNVFRTAFRDKANNQDWSYDFWIDEETKRLVALHVPGADIYDPEKDPARNNPRGKAWRLTPVCSVQHDIVFDAELGESLFRLEPPEGYTVKVMARPQVTEKEMVDYLGVLAEYNNGTFPDQVFPFPFPSDQINRIWDKPKEERTAAEQKLLETNNHYKMAGLNEMPIAHFIMDYAAQDSFQYLGKGVGLGDKDRIVCWYRLKGSSTYRAVYGDLSTRDAAPEDLPLSVAP